MMALLFGDVTHAIHKGQSLFEIRKSEFAVDVMFVIDRPVRDALVKLV